LGGPSLRAGCVTQATMNGVSERDIMRQTGHKSAKMLVKYIRISVLARCLRATPPPGWASDP